MWGRLGDGGADQRDAVPFDQERRGFGAADAHRVDAVLLREIEHGLGLRRRDDRAALRFAEEQRGGIDIRVIGELDVAADSVHRTSASAIARPPFERSCALRSRRCS